MCAVSVRLYHQSTEFNLKLISVQEIGFRKETKSVGNVFLALRGQPVSHPATKKKDT